MNESLSYIELFTSGGLTKNVENYCHHAHYVWLGFRSCSGISHKESLSVEVHWFVSSCLSVLVGSLTLEQRLLQVWSACWRVSCTRASLQNSSSCNPLHCSPSLSQNENPMTGDAADAPMKKKKNESRSLKVMIYRLYCWLLKHQKETVICV